MNTTTTQHLPLYNHFIGIDISKSDFVIAISSDKKVSTYNNNQEEGEKFHQDNSFLLPQSLVIIEVTGGYELGLLLYLQRRAILVHRADTRKVKNIYL